MDSFFFLRRFPETCCALNDLSKLAIALHRRREVGDSLPHSKMTKNEDESSGGSCYYYFSLTALVFLFCSEWNCFSCIYFLLVLLPTICCCWFLWNFVITLEVFHGTIYENVPAICLNVSQHPPHLGWDITAQCWHWIDSVSPSNKKKWLGIQLADLPVLLDLNYENIIVIKHTHHQSSPAPSAYARHS